jgi:cell division protein FtsB
MRKLIVACGSGVICFLLLIIAVQWLQQRSLKGKLLEKEALIEELEKRNLAAGEEVERLQELSYIEVLARKYLGLVKPGEIVLQIED